MLSAPSRYEFAQIFIYSRQEKIKKILNFDNLDTYTATDILYKFIVENDIWAQSENKYDLLFDEVFFCVAVDVLRKAHNDGTNLNNFTRFCEPRILFVS